LVVDFGKASSWIFSIAWRWGFDRDSTKKGLLDENMAVGEDRRDGASKQQRQITWPMVVATVYSYIAHRK
jgi:hypothetical protein